MALFFEGDSVERKVVKLKDFSLVKIFGGRPFCVKITKFPGGDKLLLCPTLYTSRRTIFRLLCPCINNKSMLSSKIIICTTERKLTSA